MATILPFVIRRRAASPARHREGSAAIVIFPGVRYESREADCPESARKAVAGTARKRKEKRN